MTFVWSRNTLIVILHISFFFGEDLFCEVVRRPENTHEVADRFAWVTSGSIPFAWATSGYLPSDQNYWPYIVFQVQWTLLFAHVFFCLCLVIGTYILPGFFSVIFWSYLLTEISVTLSTGKKLESRYHTLFFSFLWNHFVDVFLRQYWIS